MFYFFKQQNYILSEFWHVEDQNQGGTRTTVFLEVVGENFSLPIPASGSSKHSLV